MLNLQSGIFIFGGSIITIIVLIIIIRKLNQEIKENKNINRNKILLAGVYLLLFGIVSGNSYLIYSLIINNQTKSPAYLYLR
jgi:hypothetical protein